MTPLLCRPDVATTLLLTPGQLRRAEPVLQFDADTEDAARGGLL